jgi:hypothetical protein
MQNTVLTEIIAGRITKIKSTILLTHPLEMHILLFLEKLYDVCFIADIKV